MARVGGGVCSGKGESGCDAGRVSEMMRMGKRLGSWLEVGEVLRCEEECDGRRSGLIKVEESWDMASLCMCWGKGD